MLAATAAGLANALRLAQHCRGLEDRAVDVLSACCDEEVVSGDIAIDNRVTLGAAGVVTTVVALLRRRLQVGPQSPHPPPGAYTSHRVRYCFIMWLLQSLMWLDTF